ncbi:MAG: Lrp/AsnC ligand binding domain-containing protein [Euryarchaeota archaeon]|nr:Lrp/AsnC ligand binding domain-containing protein [Euryarchaeota archaeon]
MVVAVCFINVRLGEEVKIRRKLSMFQGARDIIELFGEYDFMIVLETGDLRQVNFIVDSIRKLEGVTATKTLVGAY